jgi:ribosomal protein L35
MDKYNIKTRDKIQASIAGRKHINTEKVNKQKQRRREMHKEHNNQELHNTRTLGLMNKCY